MFHINDALANTKSSNPIKNYLNNTLGFLTKPKMSILSHPIEYHFCRSRTIAIMAPNLTNVFYAEVYRGIEFILNQNGYSLILTPTYLSSEKEATFIEEIIKKQVCGLVVLSSPLAKQDILKKTSSFLKVVAIQSDIKDADYISVTDEQGMFDAVEHLLGLGHRRIAYIQYDNSVTALKNRYQGYVSALNKYGLPLDETIVFKDHVTSSGYTTAKKILMAPNPPTAIQCANDHLAMGAYMAAEDLYLKIPIDLSVSGFDNSGMSRLMRPSLTTVEQPAFEMGKTAAQTLLKRIVGDLKTPPRKIILPTKHIIRDSTAQACR